MSTVAITHDLYDDGSETVATYQDLDTLVNTAFPTDTVMIVPNDGQTSFFFRNDNNAVCTVTLEGQKSPEGAVVDDVAYAIPDGGIAGVTRQFAYVGPKNKNLFNFAGGYCQFTAGSVATAANLKYAAVRHLTRS